MGNSGRQQKIENLWREHQAMPIPADCKGKKIDGIDLAELDAELSSCIAAVLELKRFDRERHIVLGVCRDKLSRVLGRLTAPGRAHFSRLRQLALLLIEEFA